MNSTSNKKKQRSTKETKPAPKRAPAVPKSAAQRRGGQPKVAIAQPKPPRQVSAASVRFKTAGASFHAGTLTMPCRVRPMDLAPLATSRFTGAGMQRLHELSRVNAEAAAQLAHVNAMSVRRQTAGKASFTIGDASAPRTGLSDAAALFAKALVNPFGSFNDLPSVPTSPAVETQRWTSTMRGAVSTGTTGAVGYGWLALAPYVAANNTNKLFATTPNYVTAPTANLATGAVGVTGFADAGLPYSNTTLSNGIAARLVACGVRFRNISAASNVGGMAFAVQLQDSQQVTSYNGNQLQALPMAVGVPQLLSPLKLGQVANDWNTLLWRPQDLTSLDFQPDDGVVANSNITMAIIFTGPAANIQSWEWEMTSFFEYAGVAINAGTVVAPPELEMSDADSVGLDRVLSSMQRMPLGLDPSEWIEQAAVGIVQDMAHSDTAARTTEALMGFKGLSSITVGEIVNGLLSFLAV